MISLGFNPELVELLSTIGSQSSSRMLINGHLSSAFPIQRSVRQGDPLSMHLFVLYMQPLLWRLEQLLDGPEDLITAYADDVSVITTDTNKIECAKQIFEAFGRCSGAVLNLSKSNSIDIGFIRENDRILIPWLPTSDRVKILGIVYVNSVRLMVKLNWEPLIAKFAHQLWMYKMRSLPLRQKVVVLNTFITSRIWYVASIVHINNQHIAKLTSLIGSYLWSGQPTRVAIHQLALTIEQGGLGLQLPAFKCRALLVNRHLRETGQMPFYRSFVELVQNPPNLSRIPTNCPCLRFLCQEIAYLPADFLNQPSINKFHSHYLKTIDTPKVMRENTCAGWKRIWRNISSRKLSPNERSVYYMLVNQKLVHQKLLYRMQLTDSAVCLNCNAADEDLTHRFEGCPRVANAWAIFKNEASKISNKTVTFSKLLLPDLNMSRIVKFKLLKLFINYVIFVNNGVRTIDIDALKCQLENL